MSFDFHERGVSRFARASAVRSPGGGATTHVLLAMGNGDRPGGALACAAAWATSLGAELHVIQVMPPLRPIAVSPSGSFDLVEARRRIERCVAICRQTRTWCERMLGRALPTRCLRIRFGDLAEEVAVRATELDAKLVVLSPFTGRLGSTATRLAQACLRPVLVARGLAPLSVLLAATDLEDGEYRVLRRATELAAALDASVVAVHNVSCLSGRPSAPPMHACVSPAPEVPHRVMAQLPTPVGVVVTTEIDPVDAILDQALQHRSRLIVVGTRRRRRRRRASTVPTEIVDRSSCSVLVTALEP